VLQRSQIIQLAIVCGHNQFAIMLGAYLVAAALLVKHAVAGNAQTSL